MQRAPTNAELEEYRAISLLQAVWRAHLARGVVSRLRDQKQSKLKRSFSWSKKTAGSKKSLSKIPQRQSKADSGRTDNAPPSKIRRSLSFDRFSRPWSGNISRESSTAGAGGAGWGGKAGAAAPEPKKRATVSKQLLFILLHRGPTGLGLELDATNTIVNIVKGGAADRQGYFLVGDTIASVDGVPLRGRLLQEVMDRSKSSYSFDVWRLRKVEPEEPVKANKPVRRAFSFDRKKR